MMDIGRDLQDAYEHGRQDALAEMMEYTYGMLTSEKFGLQHKIKSMMTECNEPNSSEKPNNCETCRFDDRYGEESICSNCSRHYSDCYAPKDEPQTEYERASEQREHDILYEPTYNKDDGSM